MKPGNCQVCGHEKRLLFTNYACFNERCGEPDLTEIERLYAEACTPRVWATNTGSITRIVWNATDGFTQTFVWNPSHMIWDKVTP